MWSIMTQSLPGLSHYSAYLPRLVLMLTKILPPDLAKFLRHNLLVSPSGRANHFVAKDFLLENHNYWLKYFFNRAGMGTQIDRLKHLFSPNIPQLRTMFKSLRRDSGGRHVQQSYKVYLKIRALERFTQMACDKDIIDDKHSPMSNTKEIWLLDTYLEGIKCLQREIRGKPSELGRFLLHLPLSDHQVNAMLSDADVDLIIEGLSPPDPGSEIHMSDNSSEVTCSEQEYEDYTDGTSESNDEPMTDV
ncbi:hypothetical protein PGT21_002864 [Puccinia graminis f. sp. tritici]|uniref:DUF6589 domain-containing protein n=1 Tax=Puccinia graminis f. sp. tritici TaxID=56615 RepID=A0A5B0MB66_PUCGR|nr:hypothetical protein PGT21_002864 [Puccinia graminis f. sp. tritici]